MAESSLYAGERNGPRIFRIGRLGFDQGTSDPGSQVYTGTFRSERIAPAGPKSLINFRRVDIHLLTSGTYEFTVRVWVDEARTTLGDATVQTVVVNSTGTELREVTETVAISAEGSYIQVEITVDSDDVTGLFLIEGIYARGRAILSTSARSSEVT